MNKTVAANNTSFDCFMGKWKGSSKTFDTAGNFLEETQVHMDISWKDPYTFSQVEHIENLFQVGEITLKSEIHVSGKTAFAETSHLKLQATELTPTVFLFRVESGASHTTLNNVHYFIDADNRRVITHKLKQGNTFVFQFQEFVRVERQ